MRNCPIKHCTAHVQDKMLMCRHHWAMCPPNLRSDVWRWYKAGQEKRGDASPMYFEAAGKAVGAVNEVETIEADKARQQQLL